MKSNIELITPELAETYLQLSAGNNRTIKVREVNKYARDMASGNWKLSPEAIVFNADGKLIDGHHRLSAVVVSKTPIEFYVTRDAPDECIDVIDSGVPRSLSDRYKMSGKDSIYISKSSQSLVKSIHVFVFNGGKRNNVVLSSHEIECYITRYYNLCRFANAYKGKGTISNSNFIFGVLCALASNVDAKKVYAFMKCANSGEVDTLLAGDSVNWKVANNFRTCYETQWKSVWGNKRYDLFYETEKAIFLFSQNRSRASLSNYIYLPTGEELDALNEKLNFSSFKTNWWDRV